MARRSLHAVLKVTRFLQSFKGLLRYLVHDFVSSLESCRLSFPAKIKTYASKTSQGIIKSHSTFGRELTKLANHLSGYKGTPKRAVRRRSGSECASLLNESEPCTHDGECSTCVIAAQDRLLLQYDLHLFGITESVNDLENLLCSIRVLLGRQQDRSGTHTVRTSSGLAEDPLGGESICEKLAADFQHILRILQQITLDEIIRYYLNTAESYILRWQFRWQCSKRLGEDWFAEWPNSHRPLSTTWPWNIKPSLLVLWGVCWMFYGPSGNIYKKGPTTRNPRGAAPLTEDLSTGPTSSQSQPSQQNEAWAGPTSNTYPNFSWPYPTRPGVPRRTNSDRDSHAQSWDQPPVTNLNDPVTRENTLPASYPASVPSYSYISTPSSSSSELYPASTLWPYCQGIDPVSSPAYATSYTPWPSPFDPAGSVITTPQRTDPSITVQPYAQQGQTANTGTPRVAVGSLGSLGLGLRLHMSDMQDYPSPGSSISGQTTSSYVSVLPSNVLSPGIPLMPSPSVAGDTGSHQNRRRSQEPPRNAEGLLYCNHAEHAQEQSPVFSRKCEWRKHMDKHERPYVCEEPECDNIRGFTYSGGLLRHQREVHRQHGGPKASCICPYPDCKRHIGAGFSRKENLAEHIRRVHRDAGADQTQQEGSESAQTTSGTSRTDKKRRRTAPNDDGDSEEDLELEVKKLKKQLQEKDERLEKLERQVQLLVRGQK